MDPLPMLSKELVDNLDKRFPSKSPQKGESHDSLMWRGGQRDVIDFLLATHESQMENLLETLAKKK